MPPQAVQGSGERPGDSIGPYKLLQIIGEGGFGTVWLAERREPMVQRVALKIIKQGMDTRAVVARFEQERQALAVMDHPNVAKVFDAGATPTGRPYFVMEHVPGEAITDYADRQNLSVRQRLELFIGVCTAVQHAHHKGIIHRDLKPSNILVTVRDGVATPKIIDFGIAKAISHTLTEKTIFTEQGHLIGTPEYMSPEQAEMGATDIDTRTDVYSLGVVLYELLSGMLPFDSTSLRAAGYAAICKVLREQDAPKPSTRLSTADVATGAEIARHRVMEREHLAKELRRELDWIPLKALRKDRTQRYDTPADLAKDIQRYLDGKPLEAGPEAAGYRLRKFVRRNKGVVVVVVAFLVVLAAGATGTTLASLAARDEARRAGEHAFREMNIEMFLSGGLMQFSLHGQSSTRSDITLAEQLELMADELDADENMYVHDPAIPAYLTGVLSSALSHVGKLHRAEALAAHGLQRQRSRNPGDHALVATSLGFVAWAKRDLGLASDAESLMKEAIEMRERLLSRHGANTDQLGDLIRDLGNLAGWLEEANSSAEAEPLRERALELQHRSNYQFNSPLIALRMNELVRCEVLEGKMTEAMNHAKEAVEVAASHPEQMLAELARKRCGEMLEDIRGAIANGDSDASRSAWAQTQWKSRAATIDAQREATKLNAYAWPLVRFSEPPPGTPPNGVESALGAATRAIALVPDDPNDMNTFGVAQYRAGQYGEALITLARAESEYASRRRGPQPSDRAFIAMAHWQLGHRDEARAALAAFRELAATDRWKNDKETIAWLKEAQELIGEK